MINLLNSLFGCFFALLVHDLFVTKTKEKTEQNTGKQNRKASDRNNFGDVLDGYNKYRDTHTQLYKSITREGANRIENASDRN